MQRSRTRSVAGQARVVGQEGADPLRQGEHPLAERQRRQDVVGEVGSDLHHAAGIAGGAHAAALAGEGDEALGGARVAAFAGGCGKGPQGAAQPVRDGGGMPTTVRRSPGRWNGRTGQDVATASARREREQGCAGSAARTKLRNTPTRRRARRSGAEE
jgi:hypothetical protein